MKKALFTISLAVLMVSSVAAESLWKPASESLFTDKKAAKVGDIVTILIVESSSSSQKASTDFDKSLNHSNNAGVGPLLDLLPSISASSGQSGSAAGSTSRSTNFLARISATVTQVQENGNLVIEGTRTVETNKEKQEIKLNGTVRPQDIAPDNTILSTYIADATITSTGKGPIGDRQKEGIISKLIKFLF